MPHQVLGLKRSKIDPCFQIAHRWSNPSGEFNYILGPSMLWTAEEAFLFRVDLQQCFSKLAVRIA